jgi:hypothetical protein
MFDVNTEAWQQDTVTEDVLSVRAVLRLYHEDQQEWAAV